jgi:hypothetical protein
MSAAHSEGGHDSTGGTLRSSNVTTSNDIVKTTLALDIFLWFINDLTCIYRLECEFATMQMSLTIYIMEVAIG